MPATSSSSRTRPPTPTPSCSPRSARSASIVAGDARCRGALRAALAAQGLGSRAPGVLALQVGIGSGNTTGTFNGDHDVWRLPQRDDALTGRAEPLPARAPRLPRQRSGHAAPAQPRRPRQRRPSRSPRRSTRGATGRVPGASWTSQRRIFAAARRSRRAAAPTSSTALPHAFYPESLLARRPRARRGRARARRSGARRSTGTPAG